MESIEMNLYRENNEVCLLPSSLSGGYSPSYQRYPFWDKTRLLLYYRKIIPGFFLLQFVIFIYLRIIQSFFFYFKFISTPYINQ